MFNLIELNALIVNACLFVDRVRAILCVSFVNLFNLINICIVANVNRRMLLRYFCCDKKFRLHEIIRREGERKNKCEQHQQRIIKNNSGEKDVQWVGQKCVNAKNEFTVWPIYRQCQCVVVRVFTVHSDRLSIDVDLCIGRLFADRHTRSTRRISRKIYRNSANSFLWFYVQLPHDQKYDSALVQRQLVKEFNSRNKNCWRCRWCHLIKYL